MENKKNASNVSDLSGDRSALFKPAKNIVYTLIFPLIVVSGLVFANSSVKSEAAKKPIPKLLSANEKAAVRKKWEATPDGIAYKQWAASPVGKRVYAGSAKIWRHIKDSTNIEAVVSSLSLPPGSRLGFGVMVKIDGDDYILNFGPQKHYTDYLTLNPQYRQLHSLRVNDKIIIRSRNVSHAPKYAYPIVAGDYVERDGKLIYKRAPQKGGC